MKNNNFIIQIKNLCKSYNDFELKNVSFEISKGEVVGLIGPNGAGKSTTIKAILNIIDVGSGEIIFLGKNILEEKSPSYKEEIGYVGENVDFFNNKKLGSIENYYKMYYKNWSEQTYEYLFKDIFELKKSMKVKELSKGMKVKFALALALSHKPKLLIMDEPTSGLDPIVRSKILRILKEYAQNNDIAILFSSHITEDMSKIANKVVFLNRGEILKECSIEHLQKTGYAIDDYLEWLIENKEGDYEENIL